MSKRNNGTADYEILQNRFTAFICTSMNNARINYLKKESARTSHTYDMDEEKFALIPDGSDFVSGLCEAESLANALRQIDEMQSSFKRAMTTRTPTVATCAEAELLISRTMSLSLSKTSSARIGIRSLPPLMVNI